MKNLAYRTWGLRDGPPLVLLHGFLGDSRDWERLARELEYEFYLVAVDLPGHGGNEGITLDADRAFKDFSDLLSSTLYQLGLTRYSMLGYSLGGRLSISHASIQPDSIDQLIIESAHPGLEQVVERNTRWENDQAWAKRFRDDPLMEVLQSWYHQPVFADLNCQVRESLMQHRCKTNQSGQALAAILEAFSLARQPALWGSLVDAPFSVQYLYGARDLKFQAVAQKLKALGRISGVHGVEHSGHNIHREQPGEMAELIRHFFSVKKP